MAATSLVSSTIASSDADGPLVGGISAPEAGGLSLVNPSALTQYVNADLQAAEAALPEGAQVQLTITGWQTLLGSGAQFAATRINDAWAQGRITNSDGTAVEAWPGQGFIATGDDATDTVTIQTLKGQPQLVWVIVGLIVVFVAAIVWGLLTHAKWAATFLHEAGVTTQAVGWVASHLPYIVGGAVLVATAALVLPVVGQAEEGVAEVERGSRALKRR